MKQSWENGVQTPQIAKMYGFSYTLKMAVTEIIVLETKNATLSPKLFFCK